MKKILRFLNPLIPAILAVTCAETPPGPEPGWVYEGEWGSRGAGDGEFWEPNGIAVAPNLNVYVADTFNDRIQYFTATGSYLGKWGSTGTGDGQLRAPGGVAVSAEGNVYVVDSTNERIQYFTRSGSYLGQWGSYGAGDGQFYFGEHPGVPVGVAISPSTGNVYVTDGGNHRIQYFTATGSFLGKWNSWEGGGRGFEGPSDVAVSPSSGNVYVADDGNTSAAMVLYFTKTGSHLGQWGYFGVGNGYFYYAGDIAVSPDGTVFVTDINSHPWLYEDRARIQHFTSTGSFLGAWGTVGSAESQFFSPSGVAVSPAGNRVYVVDAGNNRVQYFKRTWKPGPFEMRFP